MTLPRILKDMVLFNQGLAYLGECSTLTLPKLTRKLEEWRGGGMDSPVPIDVGGEMQEANFTCGGPMKDVLDQFAIMNLSGVYLRWVGAFENDETGACDAVEVIMRGRHEEIDFGDAEVGKVGDFKVKSKLSYYRLDWNGATWIEIDPINRVLVVNGVDRLAARSAALGL